MTDDFEGGLRVALRDASGGLPDNPNRLADVAARHARDRRRRVGAIAAALVLVLGASLLAGLVVNRDAVMLDIPKRGNGVEDLWGRKFVAVEATEGGQPHHFPADAPVTTTFHLYGGIDINSGCNSTGGSREDLAKGRIDAGTGWTMRGCSGDTSDADRWLAEFLAPRPKWELKGDTLTLSSDFGTMTLVDEGLGRDPKEIVGRQFRAWAPRKIDDGNVLLLSLARDGTIELKLGCETAVGRAEITAGWLRTEDGLSVQHRADCSPTMEAQQTDWLWDLFAQPVQWQSLQGALTLGRGADALGFNYVEEHAYRTDRSLLRDKTFRSTSIHGGGAKAAGIVDGKGVTFAIAPDGTLRASVGCAEPSISASIREGWIRFDDQQGALENCPGPEAERWLGEFLSDEPSWYLNRNDALVLVSAETTMWLADAGG